MYLCVISSKCNCIYASFLAKCPAAAHAGVVRAAEAEREDKVRGDARERAAPAVLVLRAEAHGAEVVAPAGTARTPLKRF